MNSDAKLKSLSSRLAEKTHQLSCLLLVGFAVLGMGRPIQAADSPDPYANETAAQRDARFGLFSHWGVYSVPAGEWITLKKN